MHFIGVDLAWGERKPTGLAVLDGTGRLLHVSTVMGDDEIVAALKPYAEGECMVALDAPLIVTNATGNRPAEAELNRDFSRYDAGAHPSNTGKPEFATKPRGARLAGRLGLDMNPRSGRARRALEVYPHPATISLFRLGRTLKYKNKPGRDLERLRSELVVLMNLLEGLATADPALVLDTAESAGAWRLLRHAVETAERKSQLRVVEDQVDAVVCAYVGMLAVRHPDAVSTYGDFETGYIVTPTLPEGLVPTPRTGSTAPGGDDSAGDGPAGDDAGGDDVGAEAAVRAYAERHPHLRTAVEDVVTLMQALLDDAGINYLTVTGRAKSVASFAAKIRRTVNGEPAYPHPLDDIRDQAGIRVITYVRSDVQAVAELVTDQMLVHDDRDLGLETASQGRFGYASRHMQFSLDVPLEKQYPQLAGQEFQVQIRTVLQHAWAEFEHDIRYKGSIPAEHVPDFDRRFTLAAGLLELADQEFSTIRDRLRESTEPAAEAGEHPGISDRELAAFLAGQYADAGWSRTDHYEWIAGLVADLSITSLSQLGELLRAVDSETLAQRLDYRYPPGAVRRLDDALLWTYGDDYVALPGNSHRTAALRTRLARMRG